MLTRVWCSTKFNKGARVEEHKYSNGEEHYSLIDTFGRPHNLKDYAEAMSIAKRWRMEDFTEQFRRDGWIE